MAGDCVPTPDRPCRVNLDMMPHDTALWMYLLTFVGVLVFGYGIWQMIRVWRLGADWQPGNWKVGAKRLLGALASHKKFQREKKSGTNHAWVFFGFVVLFIGTTIVAIDADFFELILNSKLLFGNQYLFFEAALDLFGLIFVLGVGYMAYRRYVEKPPQLHKTVMVEQPPAWRRIGGDAYALLFLFLIGITGFMMEALRLRHQIEVDGITYAQYSFVGNALGLLIQDWSQSTIQSSYVVLWWTHFALWTSVLAILPWTKFKHIVTSSLNVYFHDPERMAKGALIKPFDLQEMMESGSMDLPQVGVNTIREFTWKDRLSFDACTNCGRCESQCPAFAAGRPLSPRKLIQDLKQQMWDDVRAEKAAIKKGDEYVTAKLTDDSDMSVALDEATLWSCTTCRACVTECPVDINHVDMIVDMRRGLVMESKLDEHQQKLLVNLTNAGNPYGFPAADRLDWIHGMDEGINVPTAAAKTAAGERFEYLWWVGCVGSFDPRNQEVTRSVAKILNTAGIDFAVLGTEERCNGDPARRLGEEGRFQQSVMENLLVMEQYGVTKIITQCPHCLNTFANEYPEFGAKFEVIHHTQLIEQLLEENRIPLEGGKEMTVTYHDSCYLGRHNGIYDAPRNVLEANGYPVLEMAQSGDQGLCCGAGGSNMWFEIGEEKERINVIRAKQAADTGADTVVSACPFCLTMMQDGVSLSGNDMQTKDIAEIVAARLSAPGTGIKDDDKNGEEE